MNRVILLDSSPIGLITNPKLSTQSLNCTRIDQLEYLPISTIAMRRAAMFWAEARQKGQPTAGDKTIDADVILAAQASTFPANNVTIATTNVGHLSRFVPAQLWCDIVP